MDIENFRKLCFILGSLDNYKKFIDGAINYSTSSSRNLGSYKSSSKKNFDIFSGKPKKSSFTLGEEERSHSISRKFSNNQFMRQQTTARRNFLMKKRVARLGASDEAQGYSDIEGPVSKDMDVGLTRSASIDNPVLLEPNSSEESPVTSQSDDSSSFAPSESYGYGMMTLLSQMGQHSEYLGDLNDEEIEELLTPSMLAAIFDKILQYLETDIKELLDQLKSQNIHLKREKDGLNSKLEAAVYTNDEQVQELLQVTNKVHILEAENRDASRHMKIYEGIWKRLQSCKRDLEGITENKTRLLEEKTALLGKIIEFSNGLYHEIQRGNRNQFAAELDVLKVELADHDERIIGVYRAACQKYQELYVLIAADPGASTDSSNTTGRPSDASKSTASVSTSPLLIEAGMQKWLETSMISERGLVIGILDQIYHLIEEVLGAGNELDTLRNRNSILKMQVEEFEGQTEKEDTKCRNEEDSEDLSALLEDVAISDPANIEEIEIQKRRSSAALRMRQMPLGETIDVIGPLQQLDEERERQKQLQIDLQTKNEQIFMGQEDLLGTHRAMERVKDELAEKIKELVNLAEDLKFVKEEAEAQDALRKNQLEELESWWKQKYEEITLEKEVLEKEIHCIKQGVNWLDIETSNTTKIEKQKATSEFTRGGNLEVEGVLDKVSFRMRKLKVDNELILRAKLLTHKNEVEELMKMLGETKSLLMQKTIKADELDELLEKNYNEFESLKKRYGTDQASMKQFLQEKCDELKELQEKYNEDEASYKRIIEEKIEELIALQAKFEESEASYIRMLEEKKNEIAALQTAYEEAVANHRLQLEENNNELEALQRKHEAELASMQKLLADKGDELAALQTAYEESQASMQKLIEEKAEELSALQAKYDEDQANLKELLQEKNDELVAIQAKYDEYQASTQKLLEDKTSELSALQAKYDEYQASMQASLEEKSVELASLQAKYDEDQNDLNNRLQEKTDELLALQSEYDEYKASTQKLLEDKTSELSALQAKYDEYQASMQASLEEKSVELASLQAKYDEDQNDLNKRLQEKTDELLALQSEYDEYKASTQKLLEDKTSELSALQAKYDEYQASMQASLEEKIREIARLKAKYDEDQNDLNKRLQEKTDELLALQSKYNEDIATQKQINNECTQELQIKTNALAAEIETKAKLTEEKKELKHEYASLNASYDKSIDTIEEKNNEILALNKTCQEMEIKCCNFSNGIAKNEGLIENLREQLQEAKSSVEIAVEGKKKVENTCAELRDENIRVKTILNENITQISGLNDKMEAKIEEYAVLDKKNETLQEEVTHMRDKILQEEQHHLIELQNLKKRQAEEDARKDALHNEALGYIQREVDESKEALKASLVSQEATAKELEEANSSVDELTAIKKALEKEIETMANREAVLNDKLSTSSERETELSQQCVVLAARVEELKELLKNKSDELLAMAATSSEERGKQLQMQDFYMRETTELNEALVAASKKHEDAIESERERSKADKNLLESQIASLNVEISSQKSASDALSAALREKNNELANKMHETEAANKNINKLEEQARLLGIDGQEKSRQVGDLQKLCAEKDVVLSGLLESKKGLEQELQRARQLQSEQKDAYESQLKDANTSSGCKISELEATLSAINERVKNMAEVNTTLRTQLVTDISKRETSEKNLEALREVERTLRLSLTESTSKNTALTAQIEGMLAAEALEKELKNKLSIECEQLRSMLREGAERFSILQKILDENELLKQELVNLAMQHATLEQSLNFLTKEKKEISSAYNELISSLEKIRVSDETAHAELLKIHKELEVTNHGQQSLERNLYSALNESKQLMPILINKSTDELKTGIAQYMVQNSQDAQGFYDKVNQEMNDVKHMAAESVKYGQEVLDQAKLNRTTVFNVAFPKNVVPMLNTYGTHENQRVNISGMYDVRFPFGAKDKAGEWSDRYLKYATFMQKHSKDLKSSGKGGSFYPSFPSIYTCCTAPEEHLSRRSTYDSERRRSLSKQYPKNSEQSSGSLGSDDSNSDSSSSITLPSHLENGEPVFASEAVITASPIEGRNIAGATPDDESRNR